MIKAELTNGTKIFVLKIEHYVTLGVFTKALANEFYNHISERLESVINDNHYRLSYNTDKFDFELNELITNSKSFFKTLTKKKVEELLRDNLRNYGREGSIDGTLFEASYERGLALNKCHEIAREWLKKKYPHLVSDEEI
jgi:hypothetical protein